MDILKQFSVLKEQYYKPSVVLEDEQDQQMPAEDQSNPDVSQQETPPEEYSEMGTNPEADPYGSGGFGFGQDVPPKYTFTELGRLYELNKLYYRLITLDNTLKQHIHPRLDSTAKMVEDALRIFKLVIENIKVYKDKIDEILIVYYKFVERCFLVIDHHIKKLEEERKSSKKDKKDG